MNDDLQEALSKIIERSMEVAEKTGEWALDKAPELIQQFLMWELYSNILTIVVFVLIAIPLIKVLPLTIKAWNDAPDSSPIVAIGGITYSAFAIIGGLVAIISSSYNIVHILVAPEIYLIKYFI